MSIALEIFGYMGTGLVLLSMMMTSLEKLRWVNLIGSLVSLIYALLCNTWPVVVLNFGMILINGIQLGLQRRSFLTENEEEPVCD